MPADDQPLFTQRELSKSVAGVELCRGKGVMSRERRGLGLATAEKETGRMGVCNALFAAVRCDLSNLSVKSLVKLLASWECDRI